MVISPLKMSWGVSASKEETKLSTSPGPTPPLEGSCEVLTCTSTGSVFERDLQ